MKTFIKLRHTDNEGSRMKRNKFLIKRCLEIEMKVKNRSPNETVVNFFVINIQY